MRYHLEIKERLEKLPGIHRVELLTWKEHILSTTLIMEDGTRVEFMGLGHTSLKVKIDQDDVKGGQR